MDSPCSGIFVGYKDGGDYVRIRYRCEKTAEYLDLKPGARFCPGCGGAIPEDVAVMNPPCRFVCQVQVGGEWETIL